MRAKTIVAAQVKALSMIPNLEERKSPLIANLAERRRNQLVIHLQSILAKPRIRKRYSLLRSPSKI